MVIWMRGGDVKTAENSFFVVVEFTFLLHSLHSELVVN